MNRDMALAIAALSTLASFSLESFRSDGFTFQPEIGIYDRWGDTWKSRQYSFNIGRDILGIALETGRAAALITTVSLHLSKLFAL